MESNYRQQAEDILTKYNNNIKQKKGGSVMKGSQLRRQASSKGLRTSKKHK